MPKLSLHGVDIIVSYREASAERSENLYTVLRHLDFTYEDYRVWLMEADASPRFDWKRLADPKIHHVFVPRSGNFPKAVLYNLGTRLATSPVVCFHDADCISRPEYMVNCVQHLLSAEGSDEPGRGTGAMCPFQSMINIAGATKEAFVQSPDFALLPDPDKGQLPADATLLYQYNVGGVFLFRRRAFINVGGCNPACEGWGSEDNELFVRATRLGVNWPVVTKPMFHLNHDSPVRDGYSQSPQAQKNYEVEKATKEMPVPELQALAANLSRFFG